MNNKIQRWLLWNDCFIVQFDDLDAQTADWFLEDAMVQISMYVLEVLTVQGGCPASCATRRSRDSLDVRVS